MALFHKIKKQHNRKAFLLLELLIGLSIWSIAITFSSLLITQFSKSTANILAFNQKVREAQNIMESLQVTTEIPSGNIKIEPYQDYIQKQTVIIDKKHKFEVLIDVES